jgi:hypothetical protein
MTQGINSIPTRLAYGDEAAEKFMQDRIYKPEQPSAMEYAGDVGDFLEKLETEYKIPPVMPEAVALQYLTGPATSQAMKAAGRGAEKAGMALERGMEPVVKGALERGGLPREMVMAMGANTQSNVIKPKGGNWIGGDVEQALDPLITKGIIANREIPYGPEFDSKIIQRIADLKETASLPGYKGGAGRVASMLEEDLQDAVSTQNRVKNAAINKWVQSNLTNYVKKDMGTPDDPVRKLAEQDISHLPQDLQNIEMTWTPEELAKTRKRFGFPEEETATNPTAKMWEQMADEMIAPSRATEFGEKARQQNPWLEKLNPYDTVYETMRGMPQALKFDHIVDVLREDLTAGRIRPEQLNKVSMEQAVRRTFEYDQEMARKMAADRMTSRAELPVYKEYPEGLKWVELNRPGDFAAESKAMGHSVKGYEPPKGHPDWTEGSGDSGSSGYGLGGWEAIKSGRAKVYSLVDSKGEPHTTIEVASGAHPIGYSFKGASKELPETFEYNRDFDEAFPRPTAEQKQAILSRAQDLFKNNSNIERMDSFQMAANEVLGELPAEIRQIKGKGNAKPVAEYTPYVQDFVKSGKWTDVRDLPNTDLVKYGNEYKSLAEVEGLFKPKVESAMKYLEEHPALETHRQANKAYNEYKGPIPSPEYSSLDYNRGVTVHPNIPYTYNELKAILKDPASFSGRNDEIYDTLSRNLDRIEELKKHYGELPPAAGMKRGGKVSISNNPDTMMLELGNQKMAGGGAIAKLMRAAPKSKAEIDAIARRMAPQMLGEFVRGRTGSQSVAEKTQKQFAREKEMVHDIRPTGAERGLPRTVDIEELKDNVMVGIAGDPTISGKTIYSVNGVPLESPSPQHGGPLYGLEHEGDAFWASGLNAANRVQNVAREASKQYDLPVLGNYVMMGPDSINYAQHYADANLAAINPAKMSRGQIEDFNKLVRQGSKKSGPRPSFPGIENPSEAYLHFSIDPELRKHFNALMQMPTVTQKYNLPSGVDIRHAVTEPDLRDLEIGVTGKSIGRLRPEIEDLGYSEHPTYSHDIPGEFLGSSKYNIPYELSFPDTLKSVRENPKQAPQEFGSFKYVGPRQVIDQQLIDEIKQYQEMIKKYTGKKKGGAVKKAAGGAITGDDLILEERPL